MLLLNGKIVTYNPNNNILDNHALLIEDGVIAALAPQRELLERYPSVERIDAGGQLIMPGNICAHTHFYGAYARGMAIPGEPPRDFPEILTRLWWNLDRALDKDSVRASANVCLLDAIRHGTTTLLDHHASPNFIEGSLDVIADAVEQSGLRAVLCYEVTDRNGREGADAGIAENVRFMQAAKQSPRLRGTFGLHASLSLSDSTLRACADAHPTGEGYHVHVAEHEADELDCQNKHGKRIVYRLHEFGMLGRKTIAAHCVHVDVSEAALLQSTGTVISHQPRSNMNNAVGAMHFDEFTERDMRVAIGNDGFSNAMWDEWKAAYFLHKVAHRDPRRANGAKIYHAATTTNASLVHEFFPERQIGQLIEGAQADMILVDYHPFTPLTSGNLPWHILFGFESSMVTATMVDGRFLMRDRQLLTLDEQAIIQEALELAPQVWARYAQYAAE
jgi:putative selenium metabolism protein SsnA